MQQHRNLIVLLITLFFILSAQAHEQSNKIDKDMWGFALSSGHGTEGTNAYRFAFTVPYGPTWFTSSKWPVHFNWENSLGYWRAPLNSNITGPQSLVFLTTGPMFRVAKALPKWGLTPFVEAGVSGSLLSEKQIGNRRLSLHFQFEDKLGAGVRFGQSQQIEFAFRLYHYSNASLNAPNSGLNLYMISFGFWLPQL